MKRETLDLRLLSLQMEYMILDPNYSLSAQNLAIVERSCTESYGDRSA